MADIRPFCAIRPRYDLTEKIASLPYDVFNREEAYRRVQDDSYSFLRIDRPETQFDPDMDMYADACYQKAHDLLWDMVKRGELVTDSAPYYYLYELTMNRRTQTGLVACASVSDYRNNVIKKHENTLKEKEMDRIRHVDRCNAQTGPIFLSYRYDSRLDELFKEVKKKTPIFDYYAEDGVRHRGFLIEKKDWIDSITKLFSEIPSLYIADGHHRAASAVAVALQREADHKNFSHTENDYFLSVLFADRDLCIMDYNRYVEDLAGLTHQEFLDRIDGICDRRKLKEARKPSKKGSMSMYLSGQWYELIFHDDRISDDPVKGLDVSLLQCTILDPILHIKDPKYDKRIHFIGGIKGIKELQRLVDEKGGVAFAMYPTSMKELFDVADANMLMPPKSTWFEPKLHSGLFIHALK